MSASPPLIPDDYPGPNFEASRDELEYHRKRFAHISDAIARIPHEPGHISPPLAYRQLLIEVRRDWVAAIERHYGSLSPHTKADLMKEDYALMRGDPITAQWKILK